MKKKIELSKQLANASGVVENRLTNDMMFHMVMAKSERALKGIVCALQGWKEEDVKSVTLLNPINYDEYLQKETIVDTLVELNNNEVLNIELQVREDKEWIKRSLLYLCRAYDNLNGEKDYKYLKPTTHIGIMDYDLFKDHPEFYGKYLLKNVRDGYEYTDIFGMNVLSLNRTDLATEEDKANSLDYWARVFKAKTWDELKSLAGRSEAMAETAEMIYQVNADDHARSILRAHRKWEEVHTTLVNAKARAEAERDAAVARLEAQSRELEAQSRELEAQTRELEEQKQKNAELLRQLAEAQKQNP